MNISRIQQTVISSRGHLSQIKKKFFDIENTLLIKSLADYTTAVHNAIIIVTQTMHPSFIDALEFLTKQQMYDIEKKYRIFLKGDFGDEPLTPDNLYNRLEDLFGVITFGNDALRQQFKRLCSEQGQFQMHRSFLTEGTLPKGIPQEFSITLIGIDEAPKLLKVKFMHSIKDFDYFLASYLFDQSGDLQNEMIFQGATKPGEVVRMKISVIGQKTQTEQLILSEEVKII